MNHKSKLLDKINQAYNEGEGDIASPDRVMGDDTIADFLVNCVEGEDEDPNINDIVAQKIEVAIEELTAVLNSI